MRRLALATLMLALAACGHARLLNRTQYGGTFVLEGDRNKAMEDAHQQMAANCRGPYTIVAEGEHVIGSDSAAGSETYVTPEGTVVQQSGQSTRQATEWRVQYQCGVTPPPPQPPSPYAPPAPPPGAPDYGAPTAPPPPPPGNG